MQCAEEVILEVRTATGKIGRHVMSYDHAKDVAKNWLDKGWCVAADINKNPTPEEIAECQST